MTYFRRLAANLALVAAGLLWLNGGAALAEPSYQGPEVCQKCHKAEFQVWEATKHAKSRREVHKTKDPDAKAIAEATGEKKMRRNQVCLMCHYTSVEKGGKMKVVAGPSCESCHGASSEWFEIHNDYGGKDVKREDETPDHKQQRLQQAAAKGMIWPHMKYDVALNCLSCHGMTNPGLDGATLAKMLDAGHPINPSFEMVAYSQGSVRHRFYPPNMTTNAEMDSAGLSRLFVTGHAASLVSATAALSKSDHPKYVEAQNARIAAAKAALGAVGDAATLLGAPTDANARALVDKIEGQDLSGAVGGMLPAKGSYK